MNTNNKLAGCLNCGKRGQGIRYCPCLRCCCCHVGFLCVEDRNADNWTHFWRMMDSDLVLRPELRPNKPPSNTSQLTPCNNGEYHGKLRAEWVNK